MGLTDIVEQPRRHGARPGKQPEHVGQVQIDGQHDQHETTETDGALDGAADPVSGDDFRLLQAQRPRTSRSPALDGVVERPREAPNQPHDDGQRQRGEEPVDAGANERRRGVAQTFGADDRLQLACVLLRDDGSGRAEAPGIPLRDDHQQARAGPQLGRSVVLGHRDRGIANAAIADGLVQSLADPIGPKLRRIWTDATVTQITGSPPTSTGATRSPCASGSWDGGGLRRRRGDARDLAREHGRNGVAQHREQNGHRDPAPVLPTVITGADAASPAVAPAIAPATR